MVLTAIAAAVPAIATTMATDSSVTYFACVINRSGDLRVEPAFTTSSSSPDLVDCSVEIANSQSAIAGGGTTLIPGVGDTSGESLTMMGATSITNKAGSKIVMTCEDNDSEASANFPVITAIPVHSLVNQSG